MHFDIIIVGGGLVGSSLAVALRDLPCSVALVEAKLPQANDPRLFALNHTSCQLLANLHIWQALAAHAAPIKAVHVSKRGRFGAVKLTHDDIQLPQLGHVIPARYIEAALLTELNQQPNLTLFCPAKVDAMQRHANAVSLTLQHEGVTREIRSSLIIAADGAESTMRHLSAIPFQRHDYQQSALVTRTHLNRGHQSIAYERFVEDGAIAMLPLSETECATIWTASTATIQTLMALEDAAFLAQLQQSFGFRLGKFAGIKQRHIFPLQRVTADASDDPFIFLLGNALHALHPIAAQGFNLALYEVAWLAEQLQAMLQNKQALQATVLHELKVALKRQQQFTSQVSHYLADLFSPTSFLPTSLIQLGMTTLDLLPPLKRRLLNGLLGRNRRLPKLLLGEWNEKNIS